MANLVEIVGDFGTGKSSGIETLDPDTSFVIKSANKDLPFPNSRKMYNKEKKNTVYTDDWKKIINLLVQVNQNEKIKNLVLDDLFYTTSTEIFARAEEGGYDKYTEIGKHLQMILKTVEKMRDDLNVAIIFHEEAKITSDGYVAERKIKTVSKFVDEKYRPEGITSTLLYANVEFDENDKPYYHYITNRTRDFPAKSPRGMFEDLKIPNDLKYVFEKSRSYYA